MSSSIWSERLASALQQRKDQARYRRRVSVSSAAGTEQVVAGETLLNFCSNDYLGLANHPKIIEAYTRAARSYGVGSGASHLVSGHSRLHHQLEERIAEWTGRERALVFSSGYMANTGVINALACAGDLVLQDRLNHASLLDGGLISGATLRRYRHGDVAHLEQLLGTQTDKPTLVVTDGVFSMDGDIAPLRALAETCAAKGALLMVDDAHGFGCLGATGGGCLEQAGLSQTQVPVLVGTFGKAFGTFGAFVAGSESLIEYLIQFARNYIYTTALPPALAAATLTSLELIENGQPLRAQLAGNIAYFKSACAEQSIPLGLSNTAIQPVLIGRDNEALRMSEQLLSKGVWVAAIRPPTIPEGSARLRITLSAVQQKQHIDRLVEALSEALAIVASKRIEGESA